MAFGEFTPTDQCPNLIREIKNARAAEDGRCREDDDDHVINANEYSWIPLLPKIKRYKDFNELCVAAKQNEVPRECIVNNTLTGELGLLKYKLLMKNR